MKLDLVFLGSLVDNQALRRAQTETQKKWCPCGHSPFVGELVILERESQSYITTDGRSVSSPIWGS
jgi:hypothetical protein